MKFWTSGEVYGDTGNITVRLQKIVEDKINRCIDNKKYGDDVILWGFISIIMPSKLLPGEFFQEIKRYQKSKKEIEFRLKIDYKRLSSSNEIGKLKLICDSILHSIEIAKKEFRLSNFNLNALELDLRECFKREMWLD